MSNVKNFIFKKHPDSGRIHVMGQDNHLFLPCDLSAHRHPPFLSPSPRADNQLGYVPTFLSEVNYHLEGKLIYALTMEKGSHNLIPFSHTRMVIPQIYLSHVFNENWYTYVNDSLANTKGMSTNIIEKFKEIFAAIERNIEENCQRNIENIT